jgi:hypothetical protein
MRSLLKAAVIVVTFTASSRLAVAGPQTRSSEELIRSLNSGQQGTREEAVNYIHTHVAPRLRSAELDSALASELARLNGLNQNRREILRAGGRLEDDFPGEYYGAVIEVVSESSNPIVLASLVGALGTGGMAQRGLAKFGNDAVEPVVRVARAKTGVIVGGAPGDTPPHVVSDALGTLRLLVEQPTELLTTQSRSVITAVAQERLTGRQHPMVVSAACQLAVATGNPALRARVEQLAFNREELLAMGVSDSRWADQIQLMARQLLGIR